VKSIIDTVVTVVRGFAVDVGIDIETGFPRGGSRWNCGTWMDKMGESTRAGNRGIPSTPRDGAPVEIVGLAYSVAEWLSDLSENKKIEKNGFKVEHEFWSWKKWSQKIKNNFESKFWSDDGYFKGKYLFT